MTGRAPRSPRSRWPGFAASLVVLLLTACGGRSDAHVVDDLINALLAEQVEALQLAMDTWDGSGDPFSPAVEEQLEVALAGRALERARTTLPAAVADPAATGVADDDDPAATRRFATHRLVRSETACIVAVGDYRFAGLDADDAPPVVAAVSLSSASPDAGLGQPWDWRIRDVVSMTSFEDEDLADPDVLDSTCRWDG